MKKSIWSALTVASFALFTYSSASAAAPAAETAQTPVATKTIGKSVAIVNNEPIFATELEKESEPFIERYMKTAPEKERTAEKLADLRKEILNRLIEEKLLLQEAKVKKIRVTKVEIEKGVDQFKEPFAMDAEGKPRPAAIVEKAFQDQLVKEGLTQDQFNKRVEEQIMKVKMIEQEVRSKVELPQDEEVKKFFDKVQTKMAGKPVESVSKEEDADLDQLSKYFLRMTGEQVRIRHILVRLAKNAPQTARDEARKKMETVQQRLVKGEDFAFLAKKFSEDPVSRDRGGDLNFLAKGDLGLPEMDEAIFKLKDGEASGIIETEIGFHLVKMVERKSPHPLELEDVNDDLKNFMAQRTFTQRLEKYLKDLRDRSNVKVNAIE